MSRKHKAAALRKAAMKAGKNAIVSTTTAELSKDPLESLGNTKDFPTTTSQGHYYNWHYDPDLLTILLRNQVHHESAVRCKTDTAGMSYRPHINNPAFDAWLTWKVVNQSIQSLLKAARETPEETANIVKKIRELQETLEADQDKLSLVNEFYAFLPQEAVTAGIFDFSYLGNSFLRFLFESGGDIMGIRHLYARTIRVGIGKDRYFQLTDGNVSKEYVAKKILHIKMYGPESSIYGTPSYLGSQNSNILSQAYETLFLRFIENGAHLGHIFLMNFDFDDRNSETGVSPKEEKIKTDISSSKGIGNGKNWYFNLGGITDDSGQPVELDKLVKIIPLGELIQKMNMDVKASENLRNNILSAHRVPPQVMAVYVEARTTGDLDKVINLYNKNTVQPIQQSFRDAINDRLNPDQWIDFDPYMVG